MRLGIYTAFCTQDFIIARFIFNILYYLSPILLIATLIVDYKVVLGYVQWLIGLVKQSPLMGIGAIVLSALGFPVLTAFLLGKALFKKRIKQAQAEVRRTREGEFVEYEELEEEIQQDEPIKLPEAEELQPRQKRDPNQYDNFFQEK